MALAEHILEQLLAVEEGAGEPGRARTDGQRVVFVRPKKIFFSVDKAAPILC